MVHMTTTGGRRHMRQGALGVCDFITNLRAGCKVAGGVVGSMQRAPLFTVGWAGGRCPFHVKRGVPSDLNRRFLSGLDPSDAQRWMQAIRRPAIPDGRRAQFHVKHAWAPDEPSAVTLGGRHMSVSTAVT